MINNIDDVLKKTQTIFNKAKEVRSKYKDLSKEWVFITQELEKLFPKQEEQWKISADERPNMDDFIVTVGTQQGLEFNVLIYKGNINDLEDMWFKLPKLEN